MLVRYVVFYIPDRLMLLRLCSIHTPMADASKIASSVSDKLMQITSCPILMDVGCTDNYMGWSL